ncbi:MULTISPECIES: hypothetical protein [Actinomadura]|uniref:Uncharacterized protein n=1 Tax=Actinomadura litoris TaxID=2678616 RepID=A0A7K1KSW8_9ACTN|nr:MULTISPECIES: hypothetical protein [Actinomadura]MBT2208042.1 hypothetical protein [Actinomadura sp. NEAU-AAG7]MUN35115.1 hypothetical protein [Actinomadura litoris]
MVDPLTLAVAVAAAGKAVELSGEPVRDGIAAIARKVRDRFRARPAEAEILSGAIAEPDDKDRISRLAETLRRVMSEEPGFADDLQAAFQRVMAEAPEFRAEVDARVRQTTVNTTTSGGVTNTFNGTADKVIQMGDVNGGLTIN